MMSHVVVRISPEKLKRLRNRKLLSQRDLAQRAGLSPTTILHIETGQVEPTFVTVRKLTEALDVDPSELLED